MKQRELETLMHTVASELRQDGQVLRLGNDYRVTYIYLYFKDDAGHEADGELFHAGRHGDDGEGKHPKASADEAADACESLLKRLRDWQAFAYQHMLLSVFFVVTKQHDEAKAKRYLYSAGSDVDAPTPDDPLIVF